MTDLVTEKDLDKSTVVIAENKVQSRLVFGENTRMLETNLNGIKLLFREIKNGDDRIAVCTGYFDGNQWQLDSPDQSQFVGWQGGSEQPEPPRTGRPTATLSVTYSHGGMVAQQCFINDRANYWVSTGQTITLTAQFSNLEMFGEYIIEPFKDSPLLELGTVTVGRVTGDIEVFKTMDRFSLTANDTNGSAEFVLTINKEVHTEQPTVSHNVGIGDNGITYDPQYLPIAPALCVY